MPDPQVLYIVTAVVVLGLIAWVIVVLMRGKPVDAPALARETAPAGGGSLLREPQPSTPSATSSSETAAAAKASPPATPVAEPSSSDKAAIAAASKVTAKPEDPSKKAPPAKHDVPSVRVAAEVTVDVEEEEEPTGPLALILVTAVGRTDPGLKRKHNEDAYTILEDHHLFVIADGMGRHAAGEIASQLCVDAIGECFNKEDFPGPFESHMPKRANRIRSAILKANDVILKTAQGNDAYAGMGTTVVSCYFSPNNQRVYIAHVGDSRCYRVRGGKLTQITTDHTLGAAGIVGKSAAVLSRAVGVEEGVEVDVAMESPLPGDVYLLCSDGLSRMVNDEEIGSTIMAEHDLELATKKLIDTANERGGRDNITTILIRVDDAKGTSASTASAVAKKS